MDLLVHELGQVCSHHLLKEKWLIAPSLRVGNQWTEALSRQGQAVVNVRVKTLRRMTIELAESILTTERIDILSDTYGPMIVDRIWRNLSVGRMGYFSNQESNAAFFSSVYRSLKDLRLAGLGSEDLFPNAFEVNFKYDDVQLLLGEFENFLQQSELSDYAAVLKITHKYIEEGFIDFSPDLLILVPQSARLCVLEQRLVEAIPDSNVIEMPVDQTAFQGSPISQTGGTLSGLRWPNLVGAGQSQGEQANIFRAVGEINEVRQVLRICRSKCWPIDEVEVLYTDTECYVPLFYETAQRLSQDNSPRGLPLTFSEGLPLRYTRPGRLLSCWMSWISSDYSQQILVRIIQNGLIDLKEKTGFEDMAGVLRGIRIVDKQDRYLRLIDQKIKSVEQGQKVPSHDIDEKDQSIDVKNRSSYLNTLNVLRGLVSELFGLLTDGMSSTSQLKGARRLIQKYARCENELDRLARQRLLQDIDELIALVEKKPELFSLDPWNWLATQAAQIRIGGSGPRPGHLHLAHICHGGHASRAHTFVVGLDDSRFPGGGTQDSLLLDSERSKLGAGMPTSVGDLTDRVKQFTGLLAQISGTVILSFSSLRIEDDRELFASPIVMSAYRILSGNPEGDHEDLLKWLGPPASFVPDGPELSLDQTDWWLWRDPSKDAELKQVLAQHFPHLFRGEEAAEQRSSDLVTVFDGLLNQPDKQLDPFATQGPVLSATRLELLGRCPLAYYFQNVLELKAPENLSVDPDFWLDPLQFGSLLHDVFYRFMRNRIDRGLQPNVDRDLDLIQVILDKCVSRYLDLYPTPNKRSFEMQYRELREAVRIFVIDDQDHCQESKPLYFETSVGVEPFSDSLSVLDRRQPMRVNLSGGRSFRAAARIDRIDRIGDNTYAIWDYKTGTSYRYLKNPPFNRGRIVQHSVYLSVVRKLLQQEIGPKALADRFGLFFPNRRAQGERLTWNLDELSGGEQVLNLLCQIPASGVFLATDDPKDCTCCEFRSICRDIDAVTNASRAKLNNLDNDMVHPFRTLRRE